MEIRRQLGLLLQMVQYCIISAQVSDRLPAWKSSNNLSQKTDDHKEGVMNTFSTCL